MQRKRLLQGKGFHSLIAEAFPGSSLCLCVLVACPGSHCYAVNICYTGNITERCICAGAKAETDRRKQTGENRQEKTDRRKQTGENRQEQEADMREERIEGAISGRRFT